MEWYFERRCIIVRHLLTRRLCSRLSFCVACLINRINIDAAPAIYQVTTSEGGKKNAPVAASRIAQGLGWKSPSGVQGRSLGRGLKQFADIVYRF